MPPGSATAGDSRPRSHFTPLQRKPWRLPDSTIKIPPPPQAPAEPAPLNLLMSLIPPVIMIGGALVFSLITSQDGSINLAQVIPVAIMSLGFPLANIISVQAQKKKYEQSLQTRERQYADVLKKTASAIESLLDEQVRTLRSAYPDAQKLANLSLRQGDGLWSVWARRREDADFMALRFGETSALRSIKVEAPPAFDTGDRLQSLPATLESQYTHVTGVPALLELNRIGSVAISGGSLSRVHDVARRLVLDAIVHHSPEDVQVFLFAEGRESIARWEWLKWLPHTDSLHKPGGRKIPHLAFDRPVMDRVLEWLESEYSDRAQSKKSYSQASGNFAAILLLLDENSGIRRSDAIRKLAAQGWEQRIYLVFIGGRDWPRDCRSELRIGDTNLFELEENYRRDSVPTKGVFETAPLNDCERVARRLAGIEAGSDAASADLPESIRISDVLGAERLTLEAIQNQWQQDIPPGGQLIFPVGITPLRGRLELANINLLPGDILGQKVPGLGAYHTILIGTTGSGKSEFMKSVVLSAAVRYPPSLLNFFLMDFKGGAAFGIYENLPHVSGTVTNLRPELVERGLSSIANEIERRQKEFEAAQRAGDIWEYNYRKKPSHKPLMPHMILLLDEFARGLKDFPRLREPLDLLVRQGRSLGMYLVLANQDVNAEVERLLTNVGWRIALPVSKQEELTAMIGRNHKIPDRKGRGYLKHGDNILEFQAGYAGNMVSADGRTSEPAQDIFQVDADGSFIPWHTIRTQPHEETVATPNEHAANVKEEELIVSLLQKATLNLHIRPAQKIYLDPLEDSIPLEKILDERGAQLVFSSGQWQADIETGTSLVAPVGKLDIPRECLQADMVMNFDDRDGHLWIVGPGGGGKEMALTTLALSLSQCYRPDTCQFYLLDGANDLALFEKLPHTGALIRTRVQDRERLARLVRFLDAEVERRLEEGLDTSADAQAGLPHLVVIINNFKEVWKEIEDDSGVFERIVRDGNKVRIHLVLTTSRGADLMTSFRNNIARKIVLGVSIKDEHTDLVGNQFPMIAGGGGRGYWVDGANVYECQVASTKPDPLKQIRKMAETWQGALPTSIQVLPACIPLQDFQRQSGPEFVVGRAYDTLQDVRFPAFTASPTWLILGKSQTGRSNFLACAALRILESESVQRWDVRAYTLRNNKPLASVALAHPRFKLCKTMGEIEADITSLLEILKQGTLQEDQKILLLIDDLAGVFKQDAALKTTQDGLNALTPYLETAPGLIVMAAEQYENLVPIQFSSPLVKILKQNQFGVALSKDPNDLIMLGLGATDVPMSVRRMTLPVGRGIFVDHAHWALVQTPFAGECQKL